jgi:hypothetical protein
MGDARREPAAHSTCTAGDQDGHSPRVDPWFTQFPRPTKEKPMSMTAVVVLNVVLDLAVVALLAFVMRTPYRLRGRASVDRLTPVAEPSQRLAA